MAKRKVQLKKKSKSKSSQRLHQIQLYSGGYSDGCSIFRMELPRKVLNETNNAEVNISHASNIHPLVIPDSSGNKILNPVYGRTNNITIQRPVHAQSLSYCNMISQVKTQFAKQGHNIRFCVDVDDILHGDHVSKYNSNGHHFTDNKKFEAFSQCVKFSDELHVCSKAMRDFYREEIGFRNVLHKPNFLPKYYYDWFDLERSRANWEKHKAKPRILYAGAAQHFDKLNINDGKDDFSHVLDLIEKTKHEWQWVFYGAHPNQLQTDVNSGVIEFHKYTPFSDYSKKLIDLEPTVMLAPLEDNTFNRCKSNIKLTEAGALGIAGVFQDLDPYTEAPLKFNSGDEMADQIKKLLTDWDTYEKVIKEQRAFSENFFIEDPDNVKFLLATYLTDFDSTQRNALCPKIKSIQ